MKMASLNNGFQSLVAFIILVHVNLDESHFKCTGATFGVMAMLPFWIVNSRDLVRVREKWDKEENHTGVLPMTFKLGT